MIAINRHGTYGDDTVVLYGSTLMRINAQNPTVIAAIHNLPIRRMTAETTYKHTTKQKEMQV
jgi:hypothetical protein